MRIEATHRVQLVFSLLDADGNGVLEARDFDLMAGRVVAAAPDSDEAAHGAMRDAFLRYWTTLAAELDADGDGRITFEEYTACVLSPSGSTPPSTPSPAPWPRSATRRARARWPARSSSP